MTYLNEIRPLMLELFDNVSFGSDRIHFNNRALEIINEISDFAESTTIFIENIERGVIFENKSVEDVYEYMLDRAVNAPTTFHKYVSSLLIMPFLREKIINRNCL